MMENKKMRAEHPKKELAVDILYDIIGSILFGAGIYTFAEGGNFAPGGISGIALIMNKLWNLPVGTMTLILNIPLVIISYKTVGKRFLMKTARTMIISTIFVDLVFPMFPYYTGQRLLAAIYSGALLGLGMVLFYMRGSSSGGADFLTMTIKKKRPHMSLGRLTLLIDLIIILIGWPVFGDVDSVLYGLIAVFVCSMVIDKKCSDKKQQHDLIEPTACGKYFSLLRFLFLADQFDCLWIRFLDTFSNPSGNHTTKLITDSVQSLIRSFPTRQILSFSTQK